MLRRNAITYVIGFPCNYTLQCKTTREISIELCFYASHGEKKCCRFIFLLETWIFNLKFIAFIWIWNSKLKIKNKKLKLRFKNNKIENYK